MRVVLIVLNSKQIKQLLYKRCHVFVYTIIREQGLKLRNPVSLLECKPK
jgi:hypothetical protein